MAKSNAKQEAPVRSPIFGNVLKNLDLKEEYKYSADEYFKTHRAYQRIRKQLATYLEHHNLKEFDFNNDIFLSYVVAINFYYFLEKFEKKNFKIKFSTFIKNCLSIGIPLNPNTSTPPIRGTYKKHISQEEMGFFLSFLKPDSEITQKLGYQLTEEQNEGIERLIADATLTPEDKFQELMLLFYRKN